MLLKALEHAGHWCYREQPEPSEALPRSTRQADALIALAERYLGRMPHADEGLNTADRYQVTVHVSAETLREAGDIDRDDPPQIEDGAVPAADTVRRIACDVAVVPILETGAGEPLSIGRKTRTIPPALRRALKRRDGGCRFPGCVNTRFVDGHHIRHWADGGETRLDNLILLCRHHHRLVHVHEGGYDVATQCTGVVFRDPNGSIVPRTHDVVLTGDVTVLFDAQKAFGIDAWTPTPNWDGHRPDYDYVIEVLCRREEPETA